MVAVPGKSQAQYPGALTLIKSLIQDSQDSSPLERVGHRKEKFWDGPAGEQLCGEGPGCPGGRQVNHEPAVCPGCQES